MPKLPTRMYLKHGRYYLVRDNKWHSLSRDYHEALAEYARLMSQPSDGGMAAVIDRAMLEIAEDVGPKTIRCYRSLATNLKKGFSDYYPKEVTPQVVAGMMDHFRKRPATANALRNVLIRVFDRAILWGLVESNPARAIRPAKEKKRDRYLTDAEFSAIREKATPTLQAMMDMLYLTGQRIGDILALRLADISEDGIYFKQQKTGNRLTVAMTPDLADAVKRAKELHQCVRGLTLFHTRQGKPFSYNTIRTLWDRACTYAGIEDAHIHDIRAKAATDCKAQGQDSKALLGHVSESAHTRYLRSKEIPIAQPVRLRKN